MEEQQKLKQRSRGWCFTLLNWAPSDRELLEQLECVYIVFGEEVAPTTGTPHLQGYVYFKDQRTLSVLKKINKSIHWTAARGSPSANYDYCSKDNKNVHERGVRPKDGVEKGDDEKERWRSIIALSEAGDMETLKTEYPDVYFNKLGCINKVHANRKRDLDTMEGDLPHQWLYGPTGCGKSRTARGDNPGAYIKLTDSKWWDGYANEDVVIIDDLDPYSPQLGGDLKRWLDRYPFRAESKGSSSMIRPTKIVITSQYLPEECWKDEKTVSAIKRRITIVDMTPVQLQEQNIDEEEFVRSL